jgi:hypothetical protein
MTRKTKQKKGPSPIEQFNSLLAGNNRLLIILFCAIYITLSFLTFNLRISEGGDDSAYIIRALQFIEEGRFPRFQGPLYPIVLSGFVAVFGLITSLLKISSWLFMTLFLIFLWKAFSNKVSSITLAGTIFILIINHQFLYFASQTYSEAFFMLLQGGFFLYLFRTIEWQQHKQIRITQTAIIALLLVSLYLTRTVAIAATPAVVIYFATQKQKRAILFTASFFILFIATYLLLLNLLPDNAGTGNEQLTSLLQKHPYDKSQGMETFSGFLVRFWENSKTYLSKHFFILTGFKQAMSLSKPSLPAIVLYLFFIIGIVRFFKKNNQILLFTGIYVALSVGLSFFALQPLWDQVRLVIPFFPLILIFFLETIIDITGKSQSKETQRIPIFLISAAIVLSGAQTIKQTDFTSVFRNIKGEKLYGYTPDWQNYLKMSKYVAKELPEETYVACRKPNMARLHSGGKRFYGIYTFDSPNPDSLLMALYDREVSHIMVASLRKNPRKKTDQVINTIHRYMSFVAKKYPEAFVLRNQIGEDEKTWLFEIDYTTFLKNQETPETTKNQHE